MKADVVNIKGEKVADITLKEDIFGIPWNADLVHQVFVSIQANKRKPWAHTKDRSEKRGGGKKPWRQKGTGRARHGSSRSPIWSGGGVTFGPNKEKDYSKKINKKMQKKALYSVLSRKLSEGEIIFMDSVSVESGKTKELDSALKTFYKAKIVPSTLLVSGKENKTLVRPSNNIQKVHVSKASAVGIYDLLSHKNVIIEQSAVADIK